jgi:hypothetical protein
MEGDMGKYETVEKLKKEEFRRLTGVKRETFEKMLEVLKEGEKVQKAQGGKPNKLPMEERLLMTLEYLREYRTYFHVGQSYGVGESVCWRNCRWVEDCLIKSKIFGLPGKKALLKSDHEFEVILLDAAESPIERPKKKGT